MTTCLKIGNWNAPWLAMRFGTPLYVYDAEKIIANFRRIVSSIPYEPKQIHYAIMCNNHPKILTLLLDVGSSLQVNSLQEYMLAQQCGYSKQQISVTTTNISPRDMKRFITLGAHLNLDSLEEVEEYGEITSHYGDHPLIKKEIGIRVFIQPGMLNQCATNKPYDPKARVGIKREKFPEAKRIAKKYGLKITGIHGYLASNVLDLEPFLTLSSYLADCAKEFEDIEYINFGAGFGIPAKPTDKEFDWGGYGQRLTSLMHSVSKYFGREISLKIEPGRSLIGDAGTLLCEVTNVKNMDTWTQIGVNCGFGIFARPYIYGQNAGGWHDIVVANKINSKPKRLYTICGNSVLQNDFLAEDRLLPKIMVGDILAIKNAGAYGSVLMSLFPGYKKPTEILVSEAGIKTF
ncbi:MAG: hypothetical protein WC858_03765 [Parcubacteria group bacterium]|jgi:diaminopimelate decarboxylase